MIVIVIVAVALAWVVRSGRVALISGGVGGLAIGVIGLSMLLSGRHDSLRWLLILVGTVGGLALACGTVVRFTARSQETM